MALMIPPNRLQHSLTANFVTNLTRASRFIFKEDGLKGFYKGMIAATLKAGTGCYIYFTVLRYFSEDDQSASKNFFISSLARIASTILTNPLSIIETRF